MRLGGWLLGGLLIRSMQVGRISLISATANSTVYQRISLIDKHANSISPNSI